MAGLAEYSTPGPDIIQDSSFWVWTHPLDHVNGRYSRPDIL
jgi:hypothetical protein